MRCVSRRYGLARIWRIQDVEAVSLEWPVKSVTVDGQIHHTRAIFLAMGAAARQLGVPGEDALIGMGVSTCATCDGFFFRDQDVAVVGGGDSAMEEATFLTRFARTVTLIHRRDEFRASRIMLERARANERITRLTNTEVTAIEGDPRVSVVRLRNTESGDESELAVTGVFVTIGHDPRSALVHDQIDLDPGGYVLVKGRNTSTSVEGVFACGDLVDHTYRQAITVAGTGCAAAIDAERWLTENGPRGRRCADGSEAVTRLHRERQTAITAVAVLPPSTSMTAPCTKEASSLAR